MTTRSPLTPAQNEVLAWAALGQLVAAQVPDPDDPGWRATCGCGRHVMQPLDGRAARGAARRELLRDGPELEERSDGRLWRRMVLTPTGRAAVRERVGVWPSWFSAADAARVAT